MASPSTTPAKKRTRVQPPYMQMYNETRAKLDRVLVDLEHVNERLSLETAYSDTLSVLLKKKEGGGK